MESITSMCRKYTNLTAMQAELIKRINVCLPFIGDLAHAHVTLYVKAKEENKFFVLIHHKAHTFFAKSTIQGAGKWVAQIEEPLVKYTFDTGHSIRGKRELSEAESLEMYTFVVRDNGENIAVVNLETSNEYIGSSTASHVLQTVGILLLHARKQLDKDMFHPINAGNGILIADKNNRIVYTNASAIRIYKSFGHTNLIGRNVFEHQRFVQIKQETVVRSRPYEKEMEIGDLILKRRDIKIEETGSQICRIVILADITEMRKKDREIKIKSAVIQEIHHRVKNNLQTIASLLRMQARRSKSPEVKEALKESVNRILSISIVHEFLSQQDNESIDVVKVAKSIIDSVCQSMLARDFALSTEFDGPEIIIPSKNASKLSLVINELILNAIEHGFENRNEGVISVETGETDSAYQISVCDDGNGLPEDFDLEAVRSSLGLYIVNTIVAEEMGGTFELLDEQNLVEGSKKGTRARITIPKAGIMQYEE